MRPTTAALVFALAVGGCNALTGASDLSVCSQDCGAIPDGGTLPIADAGLLDGEADGGVVLPATCKIGERLCTGKVANECTGDAWKATPCSERCVDGACALHGSCQDAAGTGCGTTSSASCCATETVPGATFLRGNQAAYPATVSSFELERFEVTVGRFRAFLGAGGVSEDNPPAAGAGAHPKIPGSGWQSAWNQDLPASVAELTSRLDNGTWTATPGANEHKPITRVTWLVAFAFCAWDGARLPTYAEWSLAAVGGAEQRAYPWSSPPSSTAISAANAAYNCGFAPPAKSCIAQHCSTGLGDACGLPCLSPNTCVPTSCSGCDRTSDIALVGALSAGAARWGHLELSGNVGEYTLDDDGPQVPCSDCARLGESGKSRNTLIAGGGWNDPASDVTAAAYQRRPVDTESDSVGFRCAR
jgi:formylglycine-generating enzyme